MDGRPTRTDCDETGDYVVPNVLSPRDIVFRPDNMDETVPHIYCYIKITFLKSLPYICCCKPFSESCFRFDVFIKVRFPINIYNIQLLHDKSRTTVSRNIAGIIQFSLDKSSRAVFRNIKGIIQFLHDKSSTIVF